MSDFETPPKRAKFDFSKSATIILPISINNNQTNENHVVLNQLINNIGIENLEYDPNIPDDKPFQISMIFKDRDVRDQAINLYNTNLNHELIMSKNYEINDHAIQTQYNCKDIQTLIRKMIAHKSHIESYLISKPIDGKFYIRINGKDENAMNFLLKEIPDSRIYKSREMLALENELKVSMPLNPTIYSEEKAFSVVKTLCELAKIPFSQDRCRITLKDKTITHSNDETKVIKTMRVHYTTKDITDRDAILTAKTAVKTEKRHYFRGMTSNAQFFRNLPIRTPNHNYNTTPPTTQSQNQQDTRIITLESRIEKVEDSVKELGKDMKDLKTDMHNGFNELKKLIAGTHSEEEEEEDFEEDEEMITDNPSND